MFQALAQVDVINAQNSMEDLMATAHAQYSSVWHLYGKRFVDLSIKGFVTCKKDSSPDCNGVVMIQNLF